MGLFNKADGLMDLYGLASGRGIITPLILIKLIKVGIYAMGNGTVTLISILSV